MESALLPIADLLADEGPVVEWIVPGFISTGSLIALAGEPGAGKSFFAYTLSLALATGTDLLGWRMSPHRVLYFDQENSQPDCVEYMKWAWIGLGRPDRDLIRENLAFVNFGLGGPDWAKRAGNDIATFQPALVIIDTTTPACAIQDENDNAEATKVVSLIRRIQKFVTPSAAVIALKHAKVRKDEGGYTLRGAKAWEGTVDSVVYLIKAVGRPPKDGLKGTVLEPNKTRAFGLRETVKIVPEWVEGKRGVLLKRGVIDDEKEPPRRRRKNPEIRRDESGISAPTAETVQ